MVQEEKVEEEEEEKKRKKEKEKEEEKEREKEKEKKKKKKKKKLFSIGLYARKLMTIVVVLFPFARFIDLFIDHPLSYALLRPRYFPFSKCSYFT